ncbi:MAG: UDP-N-acetylmuramate dehydrogenase [Xenococcus sp. (in: cyanobacteria)]
MSKNLEIILPSNINWQKNVPLAPLTTLQIGGLAQYYVIANSVDELVSIYDYANKIGLPIYILGKGSNVLIDDAGIQGIVLQLSSGFHYHSTTEGKITVGGSVSMPKLARIALEIGSSGFEWMVGVPGSIGAGVAINAGAAQQCMKDNLVSATHISPSGEIVTEPASELKLRHRGSKLLDQKHIVIEATFNLDFSQPKESVADKTQGFVKKRRQKFPLRYPNCGSVFKRPGAGKGPYAGYLIESVGLKGLQIGQAQISEVHANFIINHGEASANDVKKLISIMEEKVFSQHGIMLEREVRYFPEEAKLI